MRKSQKTEQIADHRWMAGLEDQEHIGARSTASGENTRMSGIKFQDLVLARNNLNLAYQRVTKNKGAAGLDGMTVEDLLPYLKEHRKELLEQLANGTYKPAPVKRVEIPKSNGGTRKLGIPTVVDRMVQQAVAQVMSPVFEQAFSESSFGFRPGRSAQQAIKQVVSFYNEGFHRVVDLDLKAYFDTVNHDLLIKFIEQYVNDPWLTKLIRRFLTSGVMNHGLFESSEKGTPQGGPLSPLLANIYLNELDKELTKRGHKFVRYADDCNIYVKSQRAGQRVLESISNFLEGRLKVTVNQKKTQVGSPLRLKFLGFSLGVGHGGAYVRPAKEPKLRIKQALKQITKRNRGVSTDKIFQEIQQKMRGWIQYFSVGKMTTFIQTLDKWLRSRIRQYIWKQWKKTKTKINNLKRLGLSTSDAVKSANTRKGYWRTAHSKTLLYTLTNEKLERLGLMNLTKTLQFIQSA
ncbi:Mobile element protein [Pediococcus damnosus]|uniref:group II intron reverse transcriptase/maturase n=1 Tax=Pediococcus damnosus TaxID=51663 RepID=UPI00078C30FD|nr:group II intron reverse transcriptase/maturase [Pediococcus damnosus]AMV60893.1 Mobile element protein [Pediococcus damnosus]AMV65252.1 Mobile element protein [Pediococcus damnosus]